jgi:hypothetical protein
MAIAEARPMPWAAEVTKAVLPWSRPDIDQFPLQLKVDYSQLQIPVYVSAQ